MKAALDTNILVYAEGLNSDAKAAVARALIERLGPDTVVPVQVLAELFSVLTLKAGVSADDARSLVSDLSAFQTVVSTTPQILAAALDIAASHRFRIFDAIIVAAAIAAGCRLLISEDLQDGFRVQGLTVVNPFAESPHPDLTAFLAALPENL